MSWRDRLVSLIFGLVALAAVVLVILLVGAGGSTRGAAGPGEAAVPVGATLAPTSAPAPKSAAAQKGGPSRPAPPTGRPGATGRPGESGRPKPFVQGFATGTRKPKPPVASPTAKLVLPVSQDGCDHNYGDRDICVPVVFPPGVTDKCAWLRSRGYPPLKVVGRDVQHLDRDGDGTAC